MILLSFICGTTLIYWFKAKSRFSWLLLGITRIWRPGVFLTFIHWVLESMSRHFTGTWEWDWSFVPSPSFFWVALSLHSMNRSNSILGPLSCTTIIRVYIFFQQSGSGSGAIRDQVPDDHKHWTQISDRFNLESDLFQKFQGDGGLPCQNMWFLCVLDILF